MKALALAVLLPLLPAAPARAQFTDQAPDEVQGNDDQGTAEQQQQLEQTAERLKNPQIAASLAARINRSRIADRISGNSDPAQRQQEIYDWILKDPRDAAGMAIGLANDDANGTHEFEDAVAQRVHKQLQFNPNSKQGILGRLSENAKNSRLLKQQQQKADGKAGPDMADEEKREILKNMFEGQGQQSGKILTEQLEGKGPQAGPAGAGGSVGVSSHYYDRLSQSNLRGYSPQLQAMQSQLNVGRPPGAPKLIESGKLDYATLSYPAYGMSFDLRNLEKRLRYEENFALAKLLGLDGRYRGEALLDPAVEQKLKAAAAGKTLPPAFARRQAALERARAALADFSQAALAAQDPNRITRQLLVDLGSKQRGAARWITAASLEEEAQQLEDVVGFLTPDLVAAINSCPIDDGIRTDYLHRAEKYEEAARRLKAQDEAAIAALQADDWLSRVDAVQASLDQAGALRRNLSRNVDDLRSTAYRLNGSADQRPSWRRTLDSYVERFLPGSAYARQLRQEQRARDVLKDVFTKIAQGNPDAAHTVLASYEPVAPAGANAGSR